MFTLHSLRVGGITAFLKAGVPLGVLTEFIAGHASVIMNFYYQVFAATEVDSIIKQAADKLDSGEMVESDLFQRLARIREDLKVQRETPFHSQGLVFRDAAGLEMLRAARKGIIMLDLDGACPVGGALCDEGGPLVESAHASPNVLGQFGCPTCRFHVTGVPFLPGMVIKANEVIYRLRNVGMLLREVEDSLGKPGTTFGARTLLSNRLEGIKLEAENLMIEWQARVQAVLLTTGQIVTTDDSNGTGVSYVENDVANFR